MKLISDHMQKMNLIFFILIVFTFVSYATIRRVPKYYSSIQIAIDNSISGDTIIIENGIYKENINLKGKNIVIASTFVLTKDTSSISKTIIDGQQNGTVIKITNNENDLAQICGLSIKNGQSDNGGGILIDNNSKPIISFCNIYDNVAGYGGGISIRSNSKPIIRNCKIYNNHADGSCDQGSQGGGILSGNFSNARLISCEIFNNTSVCSGGGIYAISNPISNVNRFSLSIERCIIYDNVAPQGGGIASVHECNVKIVNSTIFNNHATSGSDIYLYDGNATIINSIVYNDKTATENSIYFEKPTCCTMSSWCEMYIDYSLIFGGLNSIQKVGDNAVLYYKEHNIEIDPLFLDLSKNDCTLKKNSPCIDKGVSKFLVSAVGIIVGDTLVNLNSTDFIGDAPDLGALESYNELSVTNNDLYSFVMFTNPDNGCISINSPNSIIYQYKLYDIEGQVVGGDKVNSYDFEINVSSFKRGCYLMKIYMIDSVVVEKFIKK